MFSECSFLTIRISCFWERVSKIIHTEVWLYCTYNNALQGQFWNSYINCISSRYIFISYISVPSAWLFLPIVAVVVQDVILFCNLPLSPWMQWLYCSSQTLGLRFQKSSFIHPYVLLTVLGNLVLWQFSLCMHSPTTKKHFQLVPWICSPFYYVACKE